MNFAEVRDARWWEVGQVLRRLDPVWDVDKARERITSLAAATGYPLVYLAEQICDAVFQRILDGHPPRTDIVLDDFERRLIGGKP